MNITTESHVRVVENQNAKANAEHMARLWNEEADRRMADRVDRIMAEHQFNVTGQVWDAMGY